MFAAGFITCLLLIVFFYIQISSTGEVVIDGRENFTLTAIEPRFGFTFLREWGTNGTEHCRTLHITSPSGNDVHFECRAWRSSEPQLDLTGHIENGGEFGTYTVTSGQATWVVDRWDYWSKGPPQVYLIAFVPVGMAMCAFGGVLLWIGFCCNCCTGSVTEE